MPDNADDLMALDELIETLEVAERGSRALDIRIEYCLGVALGGRVDIASTLIEEGISWKTVSETLDSRVPPYTTSLDAAVEGEAVEFAVKSEKRERWGAMHRSTNRQEFLAWAATEPLARRLAALKGRRADLSIEREREAARKAAQKAEQEAAQEAVKDAAQDAKSEPGQTPKAFDPFAVAHVDDNGEGEKQDWKVLF